MLLKTQENEETSHKLEKTSANHISDKRVISRIYKELSKLNNKETNIRILGKKGKIF